MEPKVGPLITFFSKTTGTELKALIDNPDDPQFEITAHRYDGTKKSRMNE